MECMSPTASTVPPTWWCGSTAKTGSTWATLSVRLL
jgi:hypothetical protein